MTGKPDKQEWWAVVEAMASYVACGFDEAELTEEHTRAVLKEHGYSKDAITRAVDWIEATNITSNLPEILAMLQPKREGFRVASPLESVCVSDHLWAQIERWRRHGILSSPMAEQLLEGMRTIDTRDWEDEDVEAFLTEVMMSSVPGTSAKQLRKFLKGRPQEFYS